METRQILKQVCKVTPAQEAEFDATLDKIEKTTKDIISGVAIAGLWVIKMFS